MRKNRWGYHSSRVERALIKRSIVLRSKKTGKKMRFVKNFTRIAEKYGVTRELVRQIASDLSIRSMYRIKRRKRSHKKVPQS